MKTVLLYAAFAIWGLVCGIMGARFHQVELASVVFVLGGFLIMAISSRLRKS